MTAIAETPAPPTASTPTSAPRTLRRLVLAVQVLFLVVLGLAMAFGARETSHQRLVDDLRTGRVDTVVVATHHWPEASEMEIASGCSSAELSWRRWGLKHSTSIMQPLGSTPPSECAEHDHDSHVVKGNITEHLRTLAPDVQVVHTEPSSSSLYFHDWAIPMGSIPPAVFIVAVTVGLLAMLAPLALALVGPEPRHATRWAWIWLMCSPWSLWLTLAYLFIATRGAQPGRRRLTGGWAFLLAVLLNASGS